VTESYSDNHGYVVAIFSAT